MSPLSFITLFTGVFPVFLCVSQFSSVQSLSHVRLFATPWIAAYQASLSITNSRSPPKLTSIELMAPSNHLILCHPLLLLPSVFPSIRVRLFLTIRLFHVSSVNSWLAYRFLRRQVVWTFFGFALLWNWNENWHFSSPVATAEFSKFAGVLSVAL